MEGLTIGLAFLGGLASFLSPCVLPLIPAYIGYLGGHTQSGNAGGADQRLLTFFHGLAFILGFSVVFIFFGIAVAALGGYLLVVRTILAKVGGLIVILFGLHLLGLINVPVLNYDLRYNSQTNFHPGYLSSFLMGVFFSAGWSPCIGPILGSIMMLVLNQGAVGTGIVMLSAYSLGLAVPFLIVALGMGSISAWLKKMSKFTLVIEKASGLILMVIGIMLLLDVFQRIASLGYLFK
jgi:cytochrome c-type biogenesis protein